MIEYLLHISNVFLPDLCNGQNNEVLARTIREEHVAILTPLLSDNTFFSP